MSKLSELDTLRLSDAKVNDKGETIYYARTEVIKDLMIFADMMGDQFSIDSWDYPITENFPCGRPDMILRFATKLSYPEILGYMSLVPNGHITMRTLDVMLASRFYDVICADDHNTRAKLPSNAKVIEEKAMKCDEMINEDFIGVLKRLISTGAIRIMDGKTKRESPDGLNPELEDIYPKEDLEPFPGWVKDAPHKKVKRERETKEDIGYKLRIHIRTDAKTAIQKLDKLIHKWNVIEDRDIHITTWYYDGYENKGDKNFYDGIDILEFEENEDPNKLAWEIHDAIPGVGGYKSFQYFHAPDDDNWETAYSQWLHDRSCDD